MHAGCLHVTYMYVSLLFCWQHCRNSPRSAIVIELFTPVVHRILKHCVVRHSRQACVLFNQDIGQYVVIV